MNHSFRSTPPTRFTRRHRRALRAGDRDCGAPGCANREYVRGTDDPSVDRAAMSTSLDKDDIERSLQTLLNQCATHGQ